MLACFTCEAAIFGISKLFLFEKNSNWSLKRKKTSSTFKYEVTWRSHLVAFVHCFLKDDAGAPAIEYVLKCLKRPQLARPGRLGGLMRQAMMLNQRHEQRKSLRHPMRRAAEVIFGTGEPPVRCVIWDLSEGGARLAIACPLHGLPPEFTLVMFKDAREQRQCQVVWTDTRFVGVKFL